MRKHRLCLVAAMVAILAWLSACSTEDKQTESEDLTDLAVLYAEAWSSQDPEAFSMFYAENGSLRVNDGEPSVGRDAIEETARSFMVAFPDMVVRLVDLEGYEQWTLAEDGLILESRGYYDEAEYERQLNTSRATED